MDLTERTKKLRAGDRSQVNPLCVLLFPIARAIARCYSQDDEIESTAVDALVESVWRAARALDDDNIIPYVKRNVRWRVRDAVVARSKRKVITIEGNEPAVQPTESIDEMMEVIRQLVQSDVESAFVELRATEHSYREIQEKTGVAVATLSRVREVLWQRYQNIA